MALTEDEFSLDKGIYECAEMFDELSLLYHELMDIGN
jgi:hypothetical protein